MNVPIELFEKVGYNVNFGRTRDTLGREFGSCKMIFANNTTQYDDYSLYEANSTSEIKKAYRDAHFSDDCQNARQLGEQLASGKLFNS